MKKKYLSLAFVLLAFLISTEKINAQQEKLPTISEGKFKPTDESLKQFEYPAWFRDAKFGIWSHWGPQAVPRQGDWYAKNMYIQEGSDWETRYYKHHVKTYGHPSEFGYKDIIPLWKAERWNPEELMKLFKKVGAKCFVSMGSHHDKFFLWDSKIHKWNSVKMGPEKDVVGLWQKAAKKEGLRFGISEHLAASYTWFQTSHKSDKTGSFAGVPYDGANPEFYDLYHTKADSNDTRWLTNNLEWHNDWFRYVKEVVDLYQPDLVYSDSRMPFGDIGRSLVAHYYNQDIAKNNGNLDAVYTCKQGSNGMWAEDVERGVKDGIAKFPWQTDTSIGDWYYRTGQKYMTGTQVIQMLIDIVSKNGNLLLNVVQTPEGDLETDVIIILEEIADWIKDNGEGIYGTRPWAIYGEGPTTAKTQEKGRFGGVKDVRPYGETDIRFTKKGETIFVFCMNKPSGDIKITSLGKKSEYIEKAISKVSVLGSNEKLEWKQDADGLLITKPGKMPEWEVLTFKVEFK